MRVTDSHIHALLAYDLGNGAILTRNKQVCTHMSVWSHSPVLGEHCIFGIVDESKYSACVFCGFLIIHHSHHIASLKRNGALLNNMEAKTESKY